MKEKMQMILLAALMVALSVFPAFSGGQQAASDADSVNLVYWSMWNETEPQAMVLKDAIKDFEKMNPGVNVDVQWNGREIIAGVTGGAIKE